MTELHDWKVAVPEYDAEGVVIERFEISQRQADFDKLRTALNPQRGDRSVDAGTYTRLTVDGTLWMTDTPAECRDLEPVDDLMRWHGGTMLIVGLGLGVLLNRAIHRGMSQIDVVERDRLPPRLRAAVLARVMIALGDVAAAEGHSLAGQAIVAGQAKHLGHSHAEPRGTDASRTRGSW